MFNNQWDLSNIVDISNTNLAQSILKRRNIEDLNTYLYPKLSDLHDPFLLKDMDKAVERIMRAIEDKELILIYGDYDTDGITATAVIYRFLKNLDAEATYYIPKRSEGYGLITEVLENILNEDIGLIITVDCGIPSVKEVDFINEIGIDCIISDHHTVQEEIPDAYCIISPKVSKSYPFNELSGVGIALKIVQALSIKLNNPQEYAKYIDLAALGTIADQVPLIDENRTIAKIGMDSIPFTQNVGLKELISQSYPNGINKVNSSNLMFNIIPKINASGRMESPEYAIKLLISDDYEECRKLSEKLIQLNEERKILQKEITDSVLDKIESNESIKNDSVIVLYNEQWEIGILGIVASKIVDKYNRPCILLGGNEKYFGEERIIKGTGRSVEGFNLIEALIHCHSFLDKDVETCGGHYFAAGNELKESSVDKFRNIINQYAKDKGFTVSERKLLSPDYKVNISDINADNARILSCMEPYGSENELNLFYIEDMILANWRLIGKTKDHMTMSFKKDGRYMNCISFNSAKYSKLLLNGLSYDLVFKMSLNTVRDSNSFTKDVRYYVNCEIADMRIKDIPLAIMDDLVKYSKSDANIEREDIAKVYRLIRSNTLPFKIELETLPNIPHFLICLDILQELGIINYNNIGYKFIYINELNDRKSTNFTYTPTYINTNKTNDNGRL
jgi:single-stranded-DNA-specific exonuclease